MVNNKKLNDVTSKMEYNKAIESLEKSYDALHFLWCDELAKEVREISNKLKELYK